VSTTFYCNYNYITVILYLFRPAKEFLLQTMKLHFAETGSVRASRIIEDIDGAFARMWAIVPAAEKTNPILAKEEAVTTAASSSASV
jgi:glutamate synthase domain-containing protein 3